MNSVKGLLFDLDGTLLDSRQSVVEAVYQTFNQYSPGRFSYAELESRFGESWDHCLPSLGFPDKQDVIDTYLNFVKENHDNMVAPFPGVVKNLRLLRQRGHKLAVVTNNNRCIAIRGLRLYEIDSLFDTIVTVDDVQHGKPHPEPIEKACREMGVSPSDVLMIGDTIYDVKAAHAAGAKSVVIDWYRAYHMAQCLPDYYFCGIGEFVDLLGYIQQDRAV